MTDSLPQAYCFFQNLEPRPPLDAVFERDYLLYAVSGALHVTTLGQSWLLPPSFAAWIPANTPILVDIGTPVTTCSVLVTPGFCTTMPKTPTAFQMTPMTRQMIRHCKEWGPEITHPDEASGFFLALLNVCAGLDSKSVDIQRPLATEPILRQAIQFTEAHLGEAITSSQVARAINASERNMQRRFRDNLGITWFETLTRLRMIRAVQLLAESDASVIQIAGEVGFGSLSAFNRAFRRFADQTPTELRSSLRD